MSMGALQVEMGRRRKAKGECPAYCCSAFRLQKDDIGLLWDEPESVADGHFLRDMLIELTPDEATEAHRDFAGLVGWTPEPDEHYFTCKHWDRQTLDCTRYDERPKVCRDYPASSNDGCKHGCACRG